MWPALLAQLNAKMFEAVDEIELETLEHANPEVLAARWLGFPGAAPTAIARTEARLGVHLPADYREFLLATNGFRCMAGLPFYLTSLLPVEEIG